MIACACGGVEVALVAAVLAALARGWAALRGRTDTGSFPEEETR